MMVTLSARINLWQFLKVPRIPCDRTFPFGEFVIAAASPHLAGSQRRIDGLQ